MEYLIRLVALCAAGWAAYEVVNPQGIGSWVLVIALFLLFAILSQTIVGLIIYAGSGGRGNTSMRVDKPMWYTKVIKRR